MADIETAGQVRGSAWQRLLHVAGAVDLAVLLVAGLALRDPETLAFSGLFFVALVAAGRRGGVAGTVILAVLALDTAAWMLPAAASNATAREELLDIMLPASLGIISVTAAIAGIAAATRRRPGARDGRVARLVAQVSVAALVIAALGGIAASGREPAGGASPPGASLEIGSVSFRPDRITLPCCSITLDAHNGDLFWHTLTIDALRVDVGLPTGANRRASFEAARGTYEFYCAIPGHRRAGMYGTLIVT